MTGHQGNGQAAPTTGAASPRCAECNTIGGHSLFCPRRPAPAWTLASPCACWSCDRQCGGTNHSDSCGPAADVDGRPVCAVCRGKADVFDRERHGAKVTLDQDAVRLDPDVFDTYRSKPLWLAARSARHLAAVLAERAAELDRLTAAEDGADPEQLGETPIDLWPTGTGVAPAVFSIFPERQ